MSNKIQTNNSVMAAYAAAYELKRAELRRKGQTEAPKTRYFEVNVAEAEAVALACQADPDFTEVESYGYFSFMKTFGLAIDEKPTSITCAQHDYTSLALVVIGEATPANFDLATLRPQTQMAAEKASAKAKAVRSDARKSAAFNARLGF